MPVLTSVTLFPETVQTPGVLELRLTGSPDEAKALIVTGEAPRRWSAMGLKVIVWLPAMIVSVLVWVTSGQPVCRAVSVQVNVWPPSPAVELG